MSADPAPRTKMRGAATDERRRSVLVVAGEASGDMHAAELVGELMRRVPSISVFGIGGERLQAAGLEALYDAAQMSVSGFLEVVRHYRFLRSALDRTVEAARARRPALAILVDYPGFNLRLARRLHALGIPVVYYIAPQLWAWKEGRIESLRRYVDELIVAFPFEVEYFAARGITAHFFGHPLVDILSRHVPTEAPATGRLRTVAYLPGSRHHEVARHMPLLTAVMRELGAGYHHIVALAPTVAPEQVERHRGEASFEIVGDAREALARADAALVKAGTSTVEAAFAGVPFAAYYRTSRLSYEIARRAIKVPWIAMVNILAGRAIVREFIQKNAEPSAMAKEVRRMIDDGEYRRRILDDLARVRASLGAPGAASRSAEFIASRFLT